MVGHSGRQGYEWVWQWAGIGGHTFLTASYLEEANQDTECGGQPYPFTVSGCLVDCGVQGLQKGLIRSQGLCHTAHHHRHDSKGACRGEDTVLPWNPGLKGEARRLQF